MGWRPPYSLKTTILVAVSLTFVLMAGLFSLLPYERNGSQSWLMVGVLMALSLTLLHILLSRILEPMQALSAFAQQMPDHIGQRIEIKTNILEADQLARAMNQASKNIQEQMQRGSSIVNTAPDAILGLSQQGIVKTANPACASLFGRDESQIVGQPVSALISGLEANMLHDFFGEVHRDFGRPLRIIRHDFNGSRADGTPFPIQLSLGEVRGVEDLSFACIVRDMTDERAAQESAELYERTLASSHNAVFIINAKMNRQPVVFINDAFQHVFGLLPHQVLGRNFEEVFQGLGQDHGLLALAAAIREQRNTTENLHLTLKDGRELYIKVTLSMVMSGNTDLTHFVAIASDVTANIMAEHAIAHRSTQLDTIFSLSPDGFVLFDETDHLMFANPAFERMKSTPRRASRRERSSNSLINTTN